MQRHERLADDVADDEGEVLDGLADDVAAGDVRFEVVEGEDGADDAVGGAAGVECCLK